MSAITIFTWVFATVVIIVGILCSCIYIIEEKKHRLLDLGGVLMMIFGLICCLAPTGLAIYLTWYDCTEYSKFVCNIKSLKGLNDEIKGSFAIGCGKVETDNYYYYYEDLGDGKSKFGKLSTSNTTIIETNDYHPHILEVKNKNESEHYEMYVPVGTITIEWKL